MIEFREFRLAQKNEFNFPQYASYRKTVPAPDHFTIFLQTYLRNTGRMELNQKSQLVCDGMKRYGHRISDQKIRHKTTTLNIRKLLNYMNKSNKQLIMSTQPVAEICDFPSPDDCLNVGACPDAKFRLKNQLDHFVFTVALLLVVVFTSIPCLGKELSPVSPSHAKLLEGRKLLIDEGGVVHVQITPAPVVILTNELLPLTFAFPTSEAEALEIAKFPHWGAIVPSEKALNDIVTLLEKSGLTKKAKDEIADIDSFIFTKDFKGHEYGEQAKKREGGKFSVEFVALVSRSEDRGGELRARRYSYNFDKDGLVQMKCYSDYDLLVGPALNWQTHQDSPPARVSIQTRSELVTKMLAMCGNLLPPGRMSKPDGKVEDGQ